MNLNNYVKRKIEEYIILLKKCGYVTENQTLNEIYKKLNSLSVERIYNAPGDAVIIDNKLKICCENIEKEVKKKGEYYIDEVLFHEFSHVLNSFHNAIYGENKFIISDYIQHRMNCFTTIELLEQGDELLYNQDPCFGIILLDEFIAQNISQKMVIEKLRMLEGGTKRKYAYDSNLSEYKYRYFKTNICEPPMTISTSFADYPEFDIFAKKFIKKYNFDVENFINKSLEKNFLKTFINSLNYESIEKIYIDLCYLGLIQQRVYMLKGFATINDRNDPVYDSRKVHSAMSKILKR